MRGRLHLTLAYVFLPEMRRATGWGEAPPGHHGGRRRRPGGARQGVLQPGTAFLPMPFTPDSSVGRVREVLDARIGHSAASPVPRPA
jgi:hypothetical protein